MNYALDCEFNGFGGQLISLALAPLDGAAPFYRVLDLPDHITPWVADHVIPVLGEKPIPREQCARELSEYLHREISRTRSMISIIADWPADLSEFLNLFVLGDTGMMINIPNLDVHYRQLPEFSTATASKNPHNALADAIALRDYLSRSSHDNLF